MVQTCFHPRAGLYSHHYWAYRRITVGVRVQAYGFTSKPIIAGLANAKERGVDVAVILDKSDEHARGTVPSLLHIRV